MKKLAQPTRSFFKLKISWKTSPGWLQFVFHFGTEKSGGPVKKNHPVWTNSNFDQIQSVNSGGCVQDPHPPKKSASGEKVPQFRKKKQRYFWVKRTVSMLRDCWSILCPIWFIFKPHLIQNTIYSPCRWLNNRIKHGICTTLSFFLNPEKLFFFNHDGQ